MMRFGDTEFMGTVRQLWRRWRGLCARADGSQIAELAVSLPLMMVMMVGIMDFGQAFSLKHKLETATREGARFASSQSSTDLTNPVPPSVNAVRDVIHNYLLADEINDCGLETVAPAPNVGLAWIYTANTGCPAALTLTIDRGNTYQTTSAPPLTVEASHITISYPFQWRFNRIIKLVAPTSNYAGITQINAEATMQNLD
jgi:Flp pilus assembly protein TadG